MAKQILNRRENIYVDGLPPEIASVETLVTNTDYATADKGGVVKYNNTIGTTVNSSGVLTGITRTEAQYNSGGNGMFICKGTLENIIATLVKRELIALLGGADTDETGTTLTSWFAEKTADGWNVAAAKSSPT